MIYIASTYSVKATPELMQARFEAVCRYCGECMKKGEIVYSPIVHCHPIASLVDLPRTWDFWENFDIGMIKLASSLRVLMLPGWDQSTGIAAEVAFARSLGIPVEYIEP